MTTRRRLSIFGVVLAAMVGLLCGSALGQEPAEPEVPADVRTALQDRNYDAAVRALDALIRAKKPGVDYWLYLKGLAQAYAKK